MQTPWFCPTWLAHIISPLVALLPAVATAWDYPYSVRTLPDATPTSAIRVSQRHDIVLIQHIVSIREPLRTFGGNVIIIADKVELFAPIDTRASTRIVEPYYVYADYVGLDFALGTNPNAKGAFQSYFFWTDSYNPKTRRFEYGVAAAPDMMAAPGQFAVVSNSAPAAKVGVTHPWGDANNRGADAPQVSKVALKSGDVVIIAQELLTCAGDCAPISPDSVAAMGDVGDTDRERLVVADGIKGGYGALDSVTHGGGGAAAGEDNGYSGKASRGGDAGSISIKLIGRATMDRPREEALRLLSAQGGRPPYVASLRTPSVNNISSIGNRTAFTKSAKQPEEIPLEMLGEDGRIELTMSTDTFAAYDFVAQRLNDLDGLRAYDYIGIFSGPKDYKSFQPPRTRSLLERGLHEELVLAAEAYLQSLASKLTEKPPQPARFSHPFTQIGVLGCARNPTFVLNSIEKALLVEYCNLATAVENPSKYWMANGGVFSNVPKDIESRVNQTSIQAETALVNGNLANIVKELQKIQGQLGLMIEEAQRARLIAALESARSALKQAQKSEGSPLALLQGAAKFYASLYGLGEIYSDVIPVLAKDSSWEELQDSFAWQMKKRNISFDDIYPFVRAAAFDERPSLAQERADVQNVLRALANFEEAAAKERESSLRKVGEQTRITLEAYDRVVGKTAQASLNFEPLTRALLQSHLRSADKDSYRFRKNSESVISLTREVLAPTVPLDLQNLVDVCSKGDPPTPIVWVPGALPVQDLGCASIARDKYDTLILWYKASDALNLPLAVVAPGEGFAYLSLDWVARSSDIRVDKVSAAK